MNCTCYTCYLLFIPFIISSLGRSEYLRHGWRTFARCLHFGHVLPLGELEGKVVSSVTGYKTWMSFVLWYGVVDFFGALRWGIGWFWALYTLFFFYLVFIVILGLGVKCEMFFNSFGFHFFFLNQINILQQRNVPLAHLTPNPLLPPPPLPLPSCSLSLNSLPLPPFPPGRLHGSPHEPHLHVLDRRRAPSRPLERPDHLRQESHEYRRV